MIITFMTQRKQLECSQSKEQVPEHQTPPGTGRAITCMLEILTTSSWLHSVDAVVALVTATEVSPVGIKVAAEGSRDCTLAGTAVSASTSKDTALR